MSEPNKPTTVPSVHDIVHTPGPWEITPQNGVLWNEGLVGVSGPVQVNKAGRPFRLYVAQYVEEKNAKLIAAAPEMWEAIQGALRIADLWRPSEDTPEEHWEEAKAVYMMLSKFEEIARKVV